MKTNPKKFLVNELAKIRTLAARGFSDDAIAAHMGVSNKEFQVLKEIQPCLQDWLRKGRFTCLDEDMQKLQFHIDTNSLDALKYKFKHVHGWHDQNLTIVDNSTNNIIKLPEQIPAEEYRKMFPTQAETDLIEGEVLEQGGVAVERH